MSRPDYLAPNGWRDAQQIEIRSIEGFGAWVVVPESALRASLRDFPDRTSIGHLVPVLTCKADASGDPRAPEIVNKFRIALSDPANQSAVDIPTHSSCVDALANMAVTAVRPALKAEQDSIDVSKAYYRGKPLSAVQGGRNAFAHIPPWLTGLGSLDYRRVVNGERQFLLVVGNMPGKCDAGRIFQAVMDGFLRSFGMRQLSVDRRVWVKRDGLGDLIVHDHVDDSRITATTPEVLRRPPGEGGSFHRAEHRRRRAADGLGIGELHGDLPKGDESRVAGRTGGQYLDRSRAHPCLMLRQLGAVERERGRPDGVVAWRSRRPGAREDDLLAAEAGRRWRSGRSLLRFVPAVRRAGRG
jgi:hypothetical protein